MPPEPLPPKPLGVLYVEPTYHSAGPSRGKLASLNVFTVGTDALVARFTPDFTHLANLLVATVNHKEVPSLFPSPSSPLDPPAPSAPSTPSNPPAPTSASPPPATYDHPTLRNSLDTLDPPDPPRV